MPFLLKGVADKSEPMQPDGIHTLAQGQCQILDNVWAKLDLMLCANPRMHQAKRENRVDSVA